MGEDELRDRCLALQQETRFLKRTLREKEALLVRAAAQKQRAELSGKRAVLEQLPADQKRNFRGRVADLEGQVAEQRQAIAGLKAKLRRQQEAAGEAHKRWEEKEAALRATEARLRSMASVPKTSREYQDKVRQNNELQKEAKRLREQVAALEQAFREEGRPVPAVAAGAAPGREVRELRVAVTKLTQDNQDLRRRLGVAADPAPPAGARAVNEGRADEVWDLQQIFLGDRAYLLDRATGMVLSAGKWPVPVGWWRDDQITMGWTPVQHQFYDRLEAHLGASGASLRQFFDGVDADGSGAIDVSELRALVRRIMPEAADASVPEALMLMLDRDGDGRATFDELVAGLREMAATRRDAASGAGVAEDALAKIKEFVDGDREKARQIFAELDASGDGEVTLTEALRGILGTLRQLGGGLDRREQAVLINLMMLWDRDKSGSVSFKEFCRAIGATQVRLAPPPEVARVQRERAELERERGEYQRQLKKMNADFEEERHRWLMTDGAAGDGARAEGADRKLEELRRKLRAVTQQLQDLRADHERTAGELERKRKELAESKAARDKGDDALAEARSLRARLDETRADLDQARREASENERLYRDMRGKALAAPGESKREADKVYAELRKCQEDNRKLRRDVETLRGEALRLQTAGAGQAPIAAGLGAAAGPRASSGPSPHEVMAARNESRRYLAELGKLRAELEAAHDKLAIYMQFERKGQGQGSAQASGLAAAMRDGVDDYGKSKEQLVADVRALRDELGVAEREVRKLAELLQHKDLEVQTLREHGGRLEAMQRHTLLEAGAEAEQMRKKLQARDEALRRAGERGPGLYGGAVKRTRPEEDPVVASLQPGENLLELEVVEARLDPAVGKPESGTFVAVDFYKHNTVVSSVGLGHAPRYDSTLQFVVTEDVALLRHLDTQAVALDLNRPDGFQYVTLARGRLPLARLAEELLGGAGQTPLRMQLDVFGAGHRAVARVTVRARMARPLPQHLIDDYLAVRQRQRGAALGASPVAAAMAEADRHPDRAVAVQFGVTAVQNIVPRAGLAAHCRPYARYLFPGLPADAEMVFSGPAEGTNARVDDVQEVSLLRTPDVNAFLRSHPLVVEMYDDSQEGELGVLGRATVPLADLAEGVPVDGRFPVHHPRTGEVSGWVSVFARWTDPLAPLAAGSRGPGLAAGPPGAGAGAGLGAPALDGRPTPAAEALRVVASDPWILQNAGSARYPSEEVPAVRVVPAERAGWPDDGAALVVCVDKVHLSDALAGDPRARSVAVAFDLLDREIGDAARDHHVTRAMEPAGAMVLVNHAVAHVLDPRAGGAAAEAMRRGLGERLRRGGAELDVEFRLVGVQGDGRGDGDLARCTVSLMDLVSGKADMDRRAVEMVDGMGLKVADLYVTIHGWQALLALQRQA